jgi:hypothetical protein
MVNSWTGRDQRRSPRIEVLMRVKGQLVAVDTSVLIHDLSRTGFGALSQVRFQAGQTLDFRLVGDDASPVDVTARAVHTQPLPQRPGWYRTGFMFVPGRLMGLVPQILIDQLIAAVTAEVPCL